jgi:TP901 family phage tail tape measure protein
MANGRIENSDLFAPNLGKETVETFKQLNVVLDKTESNLKDIVKATVNITKKLPSTQKGIQEFGEATQKQKQAVQLLDKVQKQRQATLQKITVLESKRGKELEKTKLKLQKVRQETKQTIKENSKLNSSYERATAKLNRLGKELKDVAFKEGANSKATRKLAKEYDVLRNKVFSAEKVAGQFQRNVGNYPSVIGKATKAFRNLGLAVGGLSVIRNVFTTVKDFDQSIANLSAITGATGKELDFLKEKAIDLGSTTTLSANQVAEGFKLIASAKPELLENAEALTEVTESAITLAEAAGIELPEAAGALANSLNQFGAGAEEAAKFVDVLAAGSKFGAGDINFLNEALISSGTVAKDAGLGIQETVAALELFAEKGIPASKAGNSFKNVLLNLQKEGKGFVDGKFNLQAAIAQVNKELTEIKDPAERAEKQIRLFGKENITTGKILLDNNGRLAEMTEKVDENGIALEQQAKNNDTLQGALKAVASAWEGFILTLEQGTGAFGFLKDVLFFVAENLTTIIKVLTVAATVFTSYKVAVTASSAVMKAYNALTVAFTASQALLSGATKKLTLAQKAAIIVQKAMNLVMKLNPIGLVVTAIASLVAAYALFADTTTDAEKAQASFNDGLKAGEEAAQSYVKELKAIGDEQLRLIELREKSGDITSEEADKARVKSFEEQKELLKDQYLATFDLIDAETIASENRIKALEAQRGVADGLLSIQKSLGGLTTGLTVDEQIKAEKLASEFKKGEIRKRADELEKAYDEQEKIVEDANASELGKEKEHQQALTDEQKKAREKRNKELELYRIRLEDLQDEAIVSSFKRETAQINRKFDRDIAKIKGNSEVETQLRLALEQARQTALEELRDKFEATEETQRKADSDKKAAQKKKEIDEALELDRQYFDAIEDEQRRNLEVRAVNNEVAASEFLVIELNRLQAELELIKIYGGDTVEVEKAIADKRHQIRIANLEEAKDSAEELADLEAELAAAQAQALQQDLQKLDKALDAIGDLLKERSDERIALLDKEIEANKSHQLELQELAAQGVVNAADNLAFEKKRQADLELQKKREIEKAAKQELALTAIKTYSGYVQQGQSGVKALASTVTDIELLKAFITGLDLFYEGTEDTGTVANPLDSNGGRLAVLHDNERVMTAKQNKMVSHLTNDELASIGSNYKNGESNIDKAMKLQRFGSNEQVLAKFDKLEKAVNSIDIPNVSFHYDSIKESFVKTIQTKGKIERIIMKKSPLW